MISFVTHSPCHYNYYYVAVVSFEPITNGGSGATIAVSESAGPLVIVLVLSKAVDEEVSVFVIATPITARGLLTYYVH